MKIDQSFTVARPRSVVWALFQDVAEVARCMPGAELTEDKGDGLYVGRLGIRLGPFAAFFDGEAKHAPAPESFSGTVEGKGVDKRGGSRSKLVLDYRLAESAGATTVSIEADIQLSGPIAQFGRVGIINETATVLIGQFVRNVEAKLAATPATGGAAVAGTPVASDAPASLNAGAMIWLVIKSFLRRLFGRAG